MALWTDILFPRRCILCEQLLLPEEEGPVCGECSLEAYWITGHRCRICSRPVQEEGGICVSCLMHGHTVPGFSLLYYRGAVRSSIHRFKYEDQRSYATGYAKLITERVGFKGAGCFVPIPIHKKSGFGKEDITRRRSFQKRFQPGQVSLLFPSCGVCAIRPRRISSQPLPAVKM